MEKPEITEEVKEALLKYSWPGNVRELKNLMERLCIFAVDGRITIDELPPYVVTNRPVRSKTEIGIKPLKQAREEAEREVIKKALEQYGRNLKEIAKVLKVDLSSLYRKLKQYNLEE